MITSFYDKVLEKGYFINTKNVSAYTVSIMYTDDIRDVDDSTQFKNMYSYSVPEVIYLNPSELLKVESDMDSWESLSPFSSLRSISGICFKHKFYQLKIYSYNNIFLINSIYLPGLINNIDKLNNSLLDLSYTLDNGLMKSPEPYTLALKS